MEDSTIVAIAGILATLVGTLGAGWISFRANLKAKQMESKNALILSRLDRREHLYSKFTEEANRLLIKSINAPASGADEFVHLSGLAHQIKLLSEDVGTKALWFADSVVEAHSETHKKDSEEQSGCLSDRRLAFIEVCRNELKQMEDQI